MARDGVIGQVQLPVGQSAVRGEAVDDMKQLDAAALSARGGDIAVSVNDILILALSEWLTFIGITAGASPISPKIGPWYIPWFQRRSSVMFCFDNAERFDCD